MIKAIVYTSETGHTQRYAQMLGKSTWLPVYSLEEASTSLELGTEIFYLGWVMIGKVTGLAKAAKRYQVRGAAACGAYAPSAALTAQLRANTGMDIPFFYLQGGVDYEKLHGLKLRMVRFMAKMAADQSKGKKASKEEEEMFRTLRQGGDFVMAKNLEEIEAWFEGVKA